MEYSKRDKVILRSRARLYSLLHLGGALKVLKLRRRAGRVQMKVSEILQVAHACGAFRDCRLLVFGLGYDSPIWCDVNKGGRTVFLEDYEPWLEKITAENEFIEAYPVSYTCNITQWEEVLDKPERLEIQLPGAISGIPWDVILVDGPRGFRYTEDQPGRMSSIFMASRLCTPGGYVFVHDAERPVESAYSARYLGEENLVNKIRGRSLLKQYLVVRS